jgi:hypothetical protein
MGSLTGGPKDEDPPRLVESIPENYSLNFDEKRIEITFDEFIQLDNVNQELVISPPIGAKPDVRLRSKSILIELESELLENTTYTLNFGNAIKDNNESNPLTNFEFVFSTGDYLDSLSVGGTLLRAFDLTPPEDPVMIMLYDNLSDSVVFHELPVYIGKTGKEGVYRINNLKADTFKLFALKDVNNNFLFDLPNEQIAFLDTTVIIDPEFFSKIAEEEQDSLFNDSLVVVSTDTLESIPSDSLEIAEQDSLMRETAGITPDRVLIDLFLFTEDHETQYLADFDRSMRNKLEFSFNLPVTDSFSYRSLIPGFEDWYLKEITPDRDSFALWIINDEVSSLDTLSLEMNYVVTDSMNRKVWATDTLFFTYREPAKSSRKKEEDKTEEKLEIETFKSRAILDLNQKVKFVSTTPVNSVDTSRVIFTQIVDTLELREPYHMYNDSTHLRKVVFDKSWEPEGKYHFTAYPGAFYDVYGKTNDTIDVRFSVRDEGYYGTLIVSLDTVSMPLIVQLLNTRDEVIKEQAITELNEIRFPFLKPDKYKLKLIYDRNGNEEWDTGNYIKGLQPEKVRFYKGEIEVRANWELEVKMETLESLPSD